MKNLGKLVLVFSMFLLVGCSKDMESRLPGTWDFTTVYSVSGQTANITGSVTFNDDGTGSYTPTGLPTQAIVWTSKDDESITINGDTYNNTTNKRKEQVFVSEGGNETMTLTQD